jgi:hypothetical protein
MSISLIPILKNNCYCFFSLFLLLISCTPSSPPQQAVIQEIKKDTLKIDSVKKAEVSKTVVPRKEFVRIYNDNARFIAGLKGENGSEFQKLENNPDWKQYAAWSNAIWSRLKEGQLQKVKTWADQELSFINAPGPVNNNASKPSTLFYPFSGADFLYAHTLFPTIDQYIMIGLEPVGKVPDIRKIPTDFWENYFLALRTAMNDILTSSFFITKDMKVDFRIQELKGTLPIIMIFLERTGNKIVTMEPVEINDSGLVVDSRLEKITSHQFGQMSGIRITYEKDSSGMNENAPQKTICYFSIDLSNASLKQKPQFESFLSNQGEVTTYVKSASYLMHQSSFSTIRSQILKHSKTVIQDDSGIPLKYFVSDAENEGNQWQQPLFYGGYKAPIPMFSKFYQEDLKKNYADTANVKSLPFRIGYQNLAKKSNLLIAKKKSF